MRFFAPIVTGLLAVVALAQDLNNAISIPEGSSTLEVTAGQPLTLDWTNPSSGTVTIKLQQMPITPDSGIVLVSGVPASDLTATVQIPDAADVNSFQYTIQIVDDSNPDNYNFSPNFGIQGATGTATGSSTGTATSTGTSTGSESTSATTTGSESTTATSTDSTSTTSESSTTSDSSTSDSSTAAAATETTSAPDSTNGAGSLKFQGSFLALAGALIAVM